jgi:hypothetical protein
MTTKDTFIVQCRFDSNPDEWYEGYYSSYNSLEEAEKLIKAILKLSEVNDEMNYKVFGKRVIERRIVKRTTTIDISETVLATY